jgi:hypothetical protein
MQTDMQNPNEQIEQEIYMTWTSPSRLFKRRDKEYFTNIGAIVFLLTIILIFAKEFVLVAAVLAIVFVVYVLSTVPPEDVSHKLMNLGVESAGHFYRWQEFREFWFEEQWGQTMLIIVPILGSRIIILLSHEQKKDDVRSIVAKHIPYRETPEKTWVDTAASWLSDKVPLEKPDQTS